MKKHWLTAIIMAVLLLAQAVAACGGALAEGEEHVHEWSAWESKGTYHEHHCTAEGCDEVETASHDIPCEICGDGMPEHTHEWSAWESKGTYHERHCTAEGCDEVETASHDIPCEICGDGMPEHTHEWSAWESKGTYHERHCTAEGCDEVEKVSHDIPCEICGEGVHTHKWSEHYRANDVYHWIWCEVEGCNASKQGGRHVFAGGGCIICKYLEPYLAHNWGDWEYDTEMHWQHCTDEGCDMHADIGYHNMVDGKCSVCGYTIDHKEHDFSGDWIKDDVDHWHVCTIEGCGAVDEYISHTMIPNAENNGFVCSVCGYECSHKDHIVGKWNFDDEGHWIVCAVEGCNAIDPSSFSEHELEDNDNGGVKCKICGYTREHKEHQWSEYYYANNVYHWIPCKAEGCNAIKYGGKHLFAGGICTICNYQEPYLAHNWSDWEYDAERHWQRCMDEGCGMYADVGNHNMVDGKCSVCSYEKLHTHEWSAWEGVATGHKRECKVCHYVESVDHGKDVYNAGKCDICGFTMHDAQDEWKNDENTHWHGCKFDGCEEKYDEAEHTWGEWIAEGTFHERECTVCHRVQHENHDLTDGKCDICGFTMHGAQDEWKNDENTHWHGCKFDGCEEKYDEAEHTWGEWIAEGTFHERECTVCHRVQHENHDLTDGKCDICGFTMHGAQDEWKNDEHTHWHGCKFDGCKDKFDENEHDFVNGVCRVCGYGKIDYPVYDDVQPVVSAPLPPQTGDASYLAIGIGMIATALCIALRKRQSN